METVRRFIAWFADDTTDHHSLACDEVTLKLATLEDAARVAMAVHSSCTR
jgi:hypothetical protein